MNAQISSLKPFGIPEGLDPREWRKALESRLNDLLDKSFALITALDLMEADCDLEDTADDEYTLGWTERGHATGAHNTDRELDGSDCEDGGDTEPSLGSLGGSQERWAAGYNGWKEDREEENEHAGDVLDEPHDALDQGDDEPSLGWSEVADLHGIGLDGWSDVDDGGTAAGLLFDGDGNQKARELLRSRRPIGQNSNVHLLSGYGWLQ